MTVQTEFSASTRKCSKNVRFPCHSCALHKLCLPVGLTTEEEKLHLEKLIEKQVLIAKGMAVCEQGEAFDGLFVVRSGAFKAVSQDGEDEMVSAFYLPGEFFGIEAISDSIYPTSVIALEDSSVCVLSFDKLLDLMRVLPVMQKHFIRLLSQKVSESNYSLLHHHTAEERLMVFLRRLSNHFEKRGFSGTEFNLPMPRKDIANYLDLANETISRLFASLQEKGVLEVDHKTIRVLPDTERA